MTGLRRGGRDGYPAAVDRGVVVRVRGRGGDGRSARGDLLALGEFLGRAGDQERCPRGLRRHGRKLVLPDEREEPDEGGAHPGGAVYAVFMLF